MSPVLNRTSCGTEIDDSKHKIPVLSRHQNNSHFLSTVYAFISRYHSCQMTKTKCSIVSVLSFACWNFKITCTILFLKVTIYVAEFQQLKQEMFLWILFWAVTVGLTLSLQDYSNNFVTLHVLFNLWIKFCGLTIKMKPLFHHLMFHSTIILFLSILQKGILHSFWEINT